MTNPALQSQMISAKDALRHAVKALNDAQIESASLDARLLLEHVLGVSREQLLAEDGMLLSPHQDADYRALIEERKSRRPVAQLLGRREFWGLNFKVTQETLDPRPDSEALIEALLECVPDRSAKLRVLDLGTGTGCLLLTLLTLLENATGVGVDISETALLVAKENAEKLGLGERARFLQSSWGDKLEGLFDVIVANPPYIPTQVIGTLHPEVCEFEPHVALDGGADGMDCYRAIMAQLPRLLDKSGVAAFEIGMGQQPEFSAIVARNGMRVTGVKEDLAGIARCILVQQQGQTQ